MLTPLCYHVRDHPEPTQFQKGKFGGGAVNTVLTPSSSDVEKNDEPTVVPTMTQTVVEWKQCDTVFTPSSTDTEKMTDRLLCDGNSLLSLSNRNSAIGIDPR